MMATSLQSARRRNADAAAACTPGDGELSSATRAGMVAEMAEMARWFA
jgi:hypothetical protein